MKATKKKNTKLKYNTTSSFYGSEENDLDGEVGEEPLAKNRQKLTNELWTRVINVNMVHSSQVSLFTILEDLDFSKAN